MPVNNDDVVGPRELGNWLGVSDRTVRDLADREVIPRASRGKYPLQACIHAYCEHMRSLAASKSGDPEEDINLTHERALLAREQREAQALKNARLRGELVGIEAVERQWADVLRRIRSRLLAVPSQVAAALPHFGQADVEAMDREIREALTELAAGGGGDG